MRIIIISPFRARLLMTSATLNSKEEEKERSGDELRDDLRRNGNKERSQRSEEQRILQQFGRPNCHIRAEKIRTWAKEYTSHHAIKAHLATYFYYKERDSLRMSFPDAPINVFRVDP